MKKIVISANWFPNKLSPYNGDFVQRHAELLSRNYKIAISHVWPDSKQHKIYDLTVSEENGIKIFICYYKRSTSKILNALRYFTAQKKTIDLAKDYLGKIDIFHVNVLTKSAFWPYIYGLLYEIPYFITEHSSYHINQQPKSIIFYLKREIQRFLVARSAGISTVSYKLKSSLIDKGINNKNFKVLPNFIDDEVFEIQERTNKDDYIIRFLHVSNLNDKPKNITGIIKAFSEAYKLIKNIELHIVGGDREEENRVEQLIKGDVAVARAIFFHGIKDKKELKEAYNNADYFIMFSNYETQSIVTLEALMCGLPVIASNIPALMEYLEKGNSVVVNPKDEVALTEVILKCAKGQMKFLDRISISTNIKKKFNNELLLSKFEEFFNAPNLDR